MSKQTPSTLREMDMNRLKEALQHAEEKLSAEDADMLKAVADAYAYLTALVEDKNTSIAKLRKMLFGAKTEKTAAVVGKDQSSENPSSPDDEANPQPPPGVHSDADTKSDSAPPAKGHGRNGADDYPGAQKIEVPLTSLAAGDPCPKCEDGTVYETGRPGVLVRLTGQPPIGAKIYYLQKLRCGLCGEVFTAEAPECACGEKHDSTVGSMIGLLKYGMGMPFNRAKDMQQSLGVPLPVSTQWEIVEAQAERAEPAFKELVRVAGQGDVVHNDDTGVKILEMMGERARKAALAEEVSESTEDSPKKSGADRTGMFTTGIVSIHGGYKIALFFSGRKHAGENLKDVLVRRAAELAAPIQMCDALSRNLPGELKTILANCLAHGRRQFVDVATRFPEECRHVLEALSVVYRNDAIARERNLPPEERLLFHQTESGPTMETLHAWLARQFDERRVEPNSALGGAISYLLKHWEKLTLFLRVAGAPLDNNVCERALKKAILHRKNALFYKTCHGAHVGDVFMSLIYTCQLCEANAFDYLTELDRHAGCAGVAPQNWMPWNYRQTLEGIEHAQTSCQENRHEDGCRAVPAQGIGETHEGRVD